MSKCVQWDLPYAKQLVSGRGWRLTLTVGWHRLCNLACQCWISATKLTTVTTRWHHLLACHWWASSLVMSLLTKSSAIKTKNWHILASFPVLLVAGHRCIMHFTLTLINFFQLVKCAIIWELSHPCQGPWHSIREAGGMAWKKANRKDVYIKSQIEIWFSMSEFEFNRASSDL